MEKTHHEQKPIMLPKYIIDSQVGGKEVYKMEGKFAEIIVNIYFRHSSVHCNVEMFFPQHFFGCLVYFVISYKYDNLFIL